MSSTGKLLFGPYEVWNFSTGAPYVPKTYKPETTDFVLGFGEWERRVTPPKDGEISSSFRKVSAIVFDGDNDRYKFHPLIFQPEKGIVSENINLFRDFEFDFEGTVPNNLRLNVPIDAQTMPNDYVEAAQDGLTVRSMEEMYSGMIAGRRPVVVGVIDDGIPFALRSLRDASGNTRVDYFWAQSAKAPVKSHVPFGLELTGPKIQQLLETHQYREDRIYTAPNLNLVDVKGDLGRNIMRFATHGAHTTDMAAGFDRHDIDGADASMIRVVGVQLPRFSLIDTSGFGKDVFVLTAVRYITSRAATLRKQFNAFLRSKGASFRLDDLPVLINVSLGVTGGPHNGTHQLEDALDEATRRRQGRNPDRNRTVIFLPTGNSFDKDTHGRIRDKMWRSTGKGGGTKFFEVPWRVKPCDRTSSYLELWFTEKDKAVEIGLAGLKDLVSISSPFGEVTIDGVPLDPTPDDVLIYMIRLNHRIIGQLSADRYRAVERRGNPGRLARPRLVIALAPTEFMLESSTTNDLCPAGVWTVTVKQHNKLRPRVDCHIQRDEDPAATGNGGKQSIFDVRRVADLNGDDFILQHDEEENDVTIGPSSTPKTEDGSHRRLHRGFVTGFGSINGWATRRHRSGSGKGKPVQRIAVAGYMDRTFGPQPDPLRVKDMVRPAPYSGSGERRFQRVDAAHRSEESPVTPGLRGSGARSGSNVYLQGTSTAAPAVIREVAIVIASGAADAWSVVSDDGDLNLPGMLEIRRDPPQIPDDEDIAEYLKNARLNRIARGQRRRFRG